MRSSFFVRSLLSAALIAVLGSCGKSPTAENSQAAVGRVVQVDYSPRIGVAVRTASRTCIAIKNAAIPADSPVTLVVPQAPQMFVEAHISGQSSNACPITKEVSVGTTNYEISLPDSSNVPKLTPLIGVVGTAASSRFAVQNNGVQADLDQTNSQDTFRACGADDGVHLTVWKGVPVTGTLVWSGSYYEAGNPGTLPTCSAAEMAPLPPAHS